VAQTTIPSHHLRYAQAWKEYSSPGISESRKEELEQEMDSAQNKFGFKEFQEFKKTLPGFIEYWTKLKDNLTTLCKAVHGAKDEH
jgi:hypothetical protein